MKHILINDFIRKHKQSGCFNGVLKISVFWLTSKFKNLKQELSLIATLKQYIMRVIMASSDFNFTVLCFSFHFDLLHSRSLLWLQHHRLFCTLLWLQLYMFLWLITQTVSFLYLTVTPLQETVSILHPTVTPTPQTSCTLLYTEIMVGAE